MTRKICGDVELRYRDESKNEKFDITGEAYRELMRACFNHSCYMSLETGDNALDFYDELQRFRIPIVDREPVVFPYWRILGKTVEIYNVCPELLDLILQKTNGFWSFKNKKGEPLNISFFRKNGTFLMISFVEEGSVTILAYFGEDYEAFLASADWDDKTVKILSSAKNIIR